MVRQVWSRDDVISIANRIAKCGTFLVNWDEQHKAIFREKIRNSKLQMNRYKGRRDPISIELYRTARKYTTGCVLAANGETDMVNRGRYEYKVFPSNG